MKHGLLKLTLTYRGSECAPVKDDSFVRRVVVPSEFSLAFLHEVIQVAFGWSNYHLYAFHKGEVSYTLPDPETGAMGKDEKPSARIAIGSIFKKVGDTCGYEYDFGDGNLVDITFAGTAKEIIEGDFEAKGQDMVEDSMAFDYTPGIVKLLAAKKQTAKAKACIKWLDEAFDLTVEDVLHVPTAREIGIRVSRLIEFVQNALP